MITSNVPTGWQCPCCQRVMAPTQPDCTSCRGAVVAPYIAPTYVPTAVPVYPWTYPWWEGPIWWYQPAITTDGWLPATTVITTGEG